MPKQLLELIFQSKYFGKYDFNVITFNGQNIGSEKEFFISEKTFSAPILEKLKAYHLKINKISIN